MMAMRKRGSLTPEYERQELGPGPMMSEQPDAGEDDLPGQKEDPEKLAPKKHGHHGVYHGVCHDADAGVDHELNSSTRNWKDLKPELDPVLKPQVPEHREVPPNSQPASQGTLTPAELRLQARRESQQNYNRLERRR